MIHASCTLFWHLPRSSARCTMKSDPEVILKRLAANGVDGSRGVTGSRLRAIEKARTGRPHSPSAGPGYVREGRALPFQLARKDRIRFRYAEASGPWLRIHGSDHDDPGTAPPSGAPYPGHTAGPVLQHRPSETLPRLWTEREGLAT